MEVTEVLKKLTNNEVSSPGALHELRATSQTVHWGYFDPSIKPVLEINSQDLVYVEAVTHHAGDAPDLMMDDGIREIYDHVPQEIRAPGPHILTGPIYVKDARPGDILEVSILQLFPRNLIGSNLAANWGFLYEDFDRTERVTIYEMDPGMQWLTAKFAYRYPGTYTEYGRLIPPGDVNRESALDGIQIPVRLHIGTIGVAPVHSGKLSSVPPGKHGGNMDNWRITAGSSLYYPVFVDGALLSLGDTHFAQGDSELSGTAVEGSLNCLIQVKVRKNLFISSPLLETPDSWIIHAFDEDLNKATRKAAREAIEFLCEFYGLSREDAYSLLSVAADFSHTQVVNGNRGVHLSIPKSTLLPVTSE